MIVYAITFKDGSSIELDERNGEIIKKAWMAQKNSPFEFKGNGYMTGDIRRIKQLSRHNENSRQLPQGKRCHGTRSIQLEISKRIKADYGKEWPKPMKDKAFREVYRHEIHDEDNSKWCDFIAGTCVCHDAPDSGKATTWRDVFPGSLETLKGEA